jgi:hypothetical protein
MIKDSLPCSYTKKTIPMLIFRFFNKMAPLSTVYQNQCFPGVLVSGGNRGILSNVFNKFILRNTTHFFFSLGQDMHKMKKYALTKVICIKSALERKRED